MLYFYFDNGYCFLLEVISNGNVLFQIHYGNLPMKYTENFFSCKNEEFHQKNIDILIYLLKHRLWVHTLTSTHNLCFGSKIRI